MTALPQPARTSESAGAGILALFKPLRKHWALVVASTVFFAGAGLLYSKSSTKIYQASSLLQIDPHAIEPLGQKPDDVMDMGAGSYWDTRDYYETQYKVISSNHVLGAVVRKLALTHDKTFMGKNKPTEEEAINLLHSKVTVDPVRNSRLVYIRVDDPDPKRAQRICDAIANTYKDQNLETAQTATSDAVVWLNGQIDHVKNDLESDENSLYEFKQRNNLPSTSINEASNMLRVEMQELDTSLTHTKTKRAEIAAREAELAKVNPDNPDQLPASELLSSQFLQSLRTEYQKAVDDRAALIASGKGEGHPLTKEATERVEKTRKALLDEVHNIQGAVAHDLAIIVRQEGTEQKLFDDTRERAVDLNMKEIEYHRLDRSREHDEKLYTLLIERMKEADLARMMRANNIHIVDAAAEPMSPIRPRTSVNFAIALLLGLALGVGLAWFREQLDSSIKTPDDLEQRLSVTFLGLLPELGDDETSPYPARRSRRRAAAPKPRVAGPMELVVHAQPLSGVAEAARTIRTNIMFMNPDKPHRKLLVTSAAPSEGKTTVACSIAIALAQSGQRVCIIDCDLRRPRLHRIFDRSGDAGITNVLVGDATIEEVAKPTGIDNLWSIPAGPTPPNPADILQSERFRKLIDDLATRFDRIIIDSPPLVAVTDSAIISTLVDGTVFVVRAFKTSYHLSAQGLRALRDVDAPVVGAVLNAVNLDRHEYGYYYHYYYYKREGYPSRAVGADDDDRPTAAPN